MIDSIPINFPESPMRSTSGLWTASGHVADSDCDRGLRAVKLRK